MLEEPQLAQRVEGVVLGPDDSPIADMVVTDCTEEWRTTLRTTKTDSKGRFHFSRQPGKNLYYLKFYHLLWNPLGLKLQLDKKAPQRGIVAKPQIGG